MATRGSADEMARIRLELEAQARDVEVLKQAMSTTLGLQGIERALEHGVSEIIGEFAPLRELLILRPTTEMPADQIGGPLPQDEAKALADLLNSLEQPRWEYTDRLPTPPENVIVIGRPHEKAASDETSKPVEPYEPIETVEVFTMNTTGDGQ